MKNLARLAAFVTVLSNEPAPRRAFYTLCANLGYNGAVVLGAMAWSVIVGRRTNAWGKYAVSSYFSMGVMFQASVVAPIIAELIRLHPECAMTPEVALDVLARVWETVGIEVSEEGRAPGARIRDIANFLRTN